MKNTFDNKKNAIISLFSFTFPLILLIIIFFILEITPFGNNTLLISDMNCQYINFLSYLKDMMKNGNDFFYTFSKNIGGDMLGFSAYYLLSPFNILLLLFSTETLPTAVSFIYLLKISLSGLTMNLYLNNKEYKYSSVIFSSMYAFIGYNIVYSFNIMWLDGIMFLPLIALGIDMIISKKKFVLYTLILALAIIINYYIGFMLCIFSALYFMYKIILNTVNSFKDIKYAIGVFTGSSVIAGGLSAFILLPTIKALSGGKSSISLSNMTFTENFKMIDVFSKTFTNSFNWDELWGGIPTIYCGFIAIVLLALYFFNFQIKLKDKLLSASFLCILLISFNIKFFDLIWHGTKSPEGFPYRYSFIFSFLVVMLAYECYKNRKGLSIKSLIITPCFLIFFAALVLSKNFEFITMKYVYFDILIIIFTSLLLYFDIYKKKSKAFFLSIFVLQALCIFLNTQGIWKPLLNANAKEFAAYVSTTSPVIEGIKRNDSNLYRMEKTFRRIDRMQDNESSLFSYNGLSHYSSGEKLFVKKFAENMGFRSDRSWGYYRDGSTSFADCLLGVKYLLSKSDIEYKPYKQLYIQNEIIVYENFYAMAFGAVVPSTITDLNLDNSDLFEYQNNIYKSMAASDNNLFVRENNIIVECDNLTVSSGDGSTIYKKIDPSHEATITYKINVSHEDALYTHFKLPKLQSVELFIQDVSFGKYFDDYKYGILSLGNYKFGDTVVFKIKLNEDSLAVNEAFFYYEKIDMIDSWHKTVSAQPCSLKKISSSLITGDVDVLLPDSYLMFTIPYEDGWDLYIDGNNKTPEKVLDTFMAVPIEVGTHTIKLEFTPVGLKLGVSISVTTLIIFIAGVIWSKVKKINIAVK